MSDSSSLSHLLGILEYDRSPHFLVGDALRLDPNYGHLYRRAEQETYAQGCSLRGVYTLQGANFSKPGTTPVVYVCEAESIAEADHIHRRVWNQNVVPFLLISCPREIRLYSGFKYKGSNTQEPTAPEEENRTSAGILRAAIQFNEIASILQSFRADAIDDGELWRKWKREVTPETRVDWHLLASLDRLDQHLLRGGIASKLLGHALIGKFVYLHYLRARGILSDGKFAEWGLDPRRSLTRHTRLDQFQLLLNKLND